MDVKHNYSIATARASSKDRIATSILFETARNLDDNSADDNRLRLIPREVRR
jgi:hypothetical protein